MNRPFTWEDVHKALNEAMTADNGVMISFGADRGGAKNFVSRANNYRLRDAEMNSKIYPKGHDLHDQSVWHKLTISAREDEGKWIVLIRKRMASIEHMEVF